MLRYLCSQLKWRDARATDFWLGGLKQARLCLGPTEYRKIEPNLDRLCGCVACSAFVYRSMLSWFKRE